MGTHKQRGFTIIELILVVGLTGALTIGLLVGTSANINAQRYRDAVQTLRSNIQNQYSDLSSIRNSRPDGAVCAKATAEISTSAATNNDKGQSDCVLLGKLLTIDKDRMTTYTIVGTRPNDRQAVEKSDLEEIRNNYKLSYEPSMTTTGLLEWGASIAWAQSGPVDSQPGDRKISMLFIKAPSSGQVYTFTNDIATVNPTDENLQNMISLSTARNQRVVCVDSGGLGPSNLAIYLSARASESGAVESRPNELLEGIAKC